MTKRISLLQNLATLNSESYQVNNVLHPFFQAVDLGFRRYHQTFPVTKRGLGFSGRWWHWIPPCITILMMSSQAFDHVDGAVACFTHVDDISGYLMQHTEVNVPSYALEVGGSLIG